MAKRHAPKTTKELLDESIERLRQTSRRAFQQATTPLQGGASTNPPARLGPEVQDIDPGLRSKLLGSLGQTNVEPEKPFSQRRKESLIRGLQSGAQEEAAEGDRQARLEEVEGVRRRVALALPRLKGESDDGFALRVQNTTNEASRLVGLIEGVGDLDQSARPGPREFGIAEGAFRSGVRGLEIFSNNLFAGIFRNAGTVGDVLMQLSPASRVLDEEEQRFSRLTDPIADHFAETAQAVQMLKRASESVEAQGGLPDFQNAEDTFQWFAERVPEAAVNIFLTLGTGGGAGAVGKAAGLTSKVAQRFAVGGAMTTGGLVEGEAAFQETFERLKRKHPDRPEQELRDTAEIAALMTLVWNASLEAIPASKFLKPLENTAETTARLAGLRKFGRNAISGAFAEGPTEFAQAQGTAFIQAFLENDREALEGSLEGSLGEGLLGLLLGAGVSITQGAAGSLQERQTTQPDRETQTSRQSPTEPAQGDVPQTASEPTEPDIAQETPATGSQPGPQTQTQERIQPTPPQQTIPPRQTTTPTVPATTQQQPIEGGATQPTTQTPQPSVPVIVDQSFEAVPGAEVTIEINGQQQFATVIETDPSMFGPSETEGMQKPVRVQYEVPVEPRKIQDADLENIGNPKIVFPSDERNPDGTPKIASLSLSDVIEDPGTPGAVDTEFAQEIIDEINELERVAPELMTDRLRRSRTILEQFVPRTRTETAVVDAAAPTTRVEQGALFGQREETPSESETIDRSNLPQSERLGAPIPSGKERRTDGATSRSVEVEIAPTKMRRQIKSEYSAASRIVPNSPELLMRHARILRRPASIADIYNHLKDIALSAGRTVPINVGRVGPGKLGWFNIRTHVIEILSADDYVTAAHEAGHSIEFLALDKDGGINHNVAGENELVALGKELYKSTEPHNGYASEGWAEFFRLYLYDQPLAKIKAPSFYASFEEWINRRGPIKRSIIRAQKTFQKYDAQGPINRAWSQVQRPPGAVAELKQDLSRRELTRKFLESGEPLATMVDIADRGRIEKNLPNIDEVDDPFLQFTRFRGQAGSVARTMVFDGMTNSLDQRVGKSLDQALAPIRPKGLAQLNIRKWRRARKEFIVYLLAKRAIALWQPTDAHPDGRNPGISLEDAEWIRNHLETDERLLAASSLYKWTDGVLNYASELSPTLAQVVENIRLNDVGHYIPLQRVFDELTSNWVGGAGKNIMAGGAPVHRLFGSGRPIKDPIQSLISNAERWVKAAHERAVLDLTVKIAEEEEGLGFLIHRVEPDVEVDAVPVLDAIKQIEDLGLNVKTKDGVEMTDLIGQTVVAFTTSLRPKGADKSRIFVAHHDGQIKYFRAEPQLIEALTTLQPWQAKGWWRVLRWVRLMSRSKRLGTTGLRPRFAWGTNAARDPMTFAMQSRASNNPASIFLNWFTSLFDSAIMTAEEFVGEDVVRKLGVHSSAVAGLYRNGGMNISGPLAPDRQPVIRAGREIFQPRIIRLADPRNTYELIADLLQVPERAPRLAEMKLMAKKLKWDPTKRVSIQDKQAWRFAQRGATLTVISGKRVTTDFTAAGTVSRVLNGIEPFHNPAIQGARTFGRTLKEKPIRTSVFGGSMAILSLYLWMMNRDKEWYKELSQEERDLFWFHETEIDGKTEVLRIPKPFEWGTVFGTIPEILAESAYRDDPELTMEILGAIHRTFMPPLPMTVPGRFAFEQANNWDLFWERPIVPESQKDVPFSEQFGPYTTEFSKMIGELFDREGVPDNVRAFAGSPRRVDHAIGSFFGGLGFDLLNGLGLGSEGSDRAKEAADLPVLGVFFRRGGTHSTQSRSMQTMYENYEKLDRESNSNITEMSTERKLLLDAYRDATQAVGALNTILQLTNDTEERKLLIEERRAITQTVIELNEDNIRGASKRYRGARRRLQKRRDRLKKRKEREAKEGA